TASPTPVSRPSWSAPQPPGPGSPAGVAQDHPSTRARDRGRVNEAGRSARSPTALFYLPRPGWARTRLFLRRLHLPPSLHQPPGAGLAEPPQRRLLLVLPAAAHQPRRLARWTGTDRPQTVNAAQPVLAGVTVRTTLQQSLRLLPDLPLKRVGTAEPAGLC